MPKRPCSDARCGKVVQGRSIGNLVVRKSGIDGAGDGLFLSGKKIHHCGLFFVV